MDNKDLLAEFQIEHILESMSNSNISEIEFSERNRRLRIKFPLVSEPESIEGDPPEAAYTQETEIISKYVGTLKLPSKPLDFVKKGETVAFVETIGILYNIESPIDGKIEFNSSLKDGSILEYGTVVAKVV